MVIKIDSNKIVTSWCEIGGIVGGIPVDSIPIEVQNAPSGKYKYIDGEFVVNADYVAPEVEPTMTVEEKIIEIQSKIDLLNESVDLLALDTLM